MTDNKRIGLAINYDYPDYGGMLQAYATFYKLEKLGYKPEALDIDNLSSSIRNRKLKYFLKNILDGSIVKEKSQIIAKKIRRKINKQFGANISIRLDAFDRFCGEKFTRSKRFADWDDLSKSCHDYRAVLVGSDQLWLPSNIEGDYYTLNFVPEDVKKIAYATSFGVSVIPPALEEKAKSYLSRIDYLSAREETGQKIIKKYTGRDVQLVCDPALLLTSDEWDETATPGNLIDEPYIFCYFMGNNPWQREFVKKLKAKTGYKIVALLHLDQYIKEDEEYVDEAPYDISPADFINLVKNAEYVCTDSFHGTVFSATYNRRFFTFIRFSEGATLSTNSRISTLLKKLGAEDRLVRKDYDLDKLINAEIDYNTVNENLRIFREESLGYLTDAIEA